MKQPAEHDEAWFREVYGQTAHLVRAFALRRVDAAAADDIVNETYATLWRHRGDDHEKMLAWLYRVASGHIAHHYRHRQRAERLADRLSSEARVGAASTAFNGSSEAIAAVLDSLKPKDAEILRLSYWEELDCGQIAIVLDCSVVSARQRLHRAKQRAKRRFAEAYDLGAPVARPLSIGQEPAPSALSINRPAGTECVS